MKKRVVEHLKKMRGGKTTPPRAPMHEVFWSALGSFIGIYLVYYVGQYQGLYLQDSLFLVGSFGASAVLIYGVPNSPFAQPRNLVGGHVISAVIGVTCALLLGSQPAFAAATAVTLAIVFMHLTRTIHPPGGATALIAVIGGDGIQQMSYWYVLSPIATGALLMLAVAVLVNNHSSYRRYPQYWL
jgi:CBS domain-containing membrane protein